MDENSKCRRIQVSNSSQKLTNASFRTAVRCGHQYCRSCPKHNFEDRQVHPKPYKRKNARKGKGWLDVVDAALGLAVGAEAGGDPSIPKDHVASCEAAAHLGETSDESARASARRLI